MPDLLRLAVVGAYLHLLYDSVADPRFSHFSIVFDASPHTRPFVWLDRPSAGTYVDSVLVTTPFMDQAAAA